MAKVEIEESELAALQRVNQFATTALANPRTRNAMLKVQKTLNPEQVIPELDAAEQVRGEFAPVMEQLAALTKKLDERDTKADEDRRTAEANARISAGHAYLAKHGYQAEGIAKIEELMLAEQTTSYAMGLALFEKLNPAPSPADMSRTSPWGANLDPGIQTSDDYKRLWESQGQDQQWLDESIAKVRSEFRNN